LPVGIARRTTARMTITQLDPADSVAMGQWYELMVAVTRHDLPGAGARCVTTNRSDTVRYREGSLAYQEPVTRLAPGANRWL
jgi:hypothetical protein